MRQEEMEKQEKDFEEGMKTGGEEDDGLEMCYACKGKTWDGKKCINPKCFKSKLDILSFTEAGIGLSNVDNASDANKPISASTQSALSSKLDIVSFTKAGIG